MSKKRRKKKADRPIEGAALMLDTSVPLKEVDGAMVWEDQSGRGNHAYVFRKVDGDTDE